MKSKIEYRKVDLAQSRERQKVWGEIIKQELLKVMDPEPSLENLSNLTFELFLAAKALCEIALFFDENTRVSGIYSMMQGISSGMEDVDTKCRINWALWCKDGRLITSDDIRTRKDEENEEER